MLQRALPVPSRSLEMIQGQREATGEFKRRSWQLDLHFKRPVWLQCEQIGGASMKTRRTPGALCQRSEKRGQIMVGGQQQPYPEDGGFEGNLLNSHYKAQREIGDKEEESRISLSPGQCGSVCWASSCKAKWDQLDSQAGHMSGFWSRSPTGGVHARGNPLMFLSHINVSLPLFPLPSPLSKKK